MKKWLSLPVIQFVMLLCLLTVFEKFQEAPGCDLLTLLNDCPVIITSSIFMLLSFLSAVTTVFLVFFSSLF